MSERMTEAEIEELKIRRTNRDGTVEVLCSKAHAEITRLRAEGAWHVADKDKWQDTQAGHLRELDRLRDENARLREALTKLISACHAGRLVSLGAGGMTIEAQTRNSIIHGVSAWAVCEAEEALDNAALTGGTDDR